MPVRTIRFSHQSTRLHLDASFSDLNDVAEPKHTVFLTDDQVFKLHPKKFKGRRTIVIPAGEGHKVQATVDTVIAQLLNLEADRQTTLVGVGGGVVTDLAGYVASIYLRGIRFGFVPTTILALVDASIGGKNGIDVGAFKNMVGVIRQPHFILHDATFLATLPEEQWRGGFAEIIKHAAIGDARMFRELEAHDISFYRRKRNEATALIARNALFKSRVVQRDEFEDGERRLLNFGHTLGHAVENHYGLSHGDSVAIGMAFAARLSGERTGFRHRRRLTDLIERYGLPSGFAYDRDQVIGVLKMDKKRVDNSIRFILLDRIGKARIEPIPIDQLYDLL